MTDKQNVAYKYNGLSFILKKEGNFNTCHSMDESWKHYAKRCKPDTNRQILPDSTYRK